MNKAIYQSLDRYLSKKSSRRDFIQAVTAVGISSLAAESLLASVQLDLGSGDELGMAPPRTLEGAGGSLLVEQLKAAGVKYIFHTNTSGLVTMTDSINTNDMQVIMITHEGQAVSTAQGYALASGELGYFMGSKVGVGNSI
ncbi:MAG: thiamine pyrophosphate-binding protein, partial [Acidobacteria bacterium]|nr:thiamine pyrophosphate-binding protein [Acidobacteriota bacterium]